MVLSSGTLRTLVLVVFPLLQGYWMLCSVSINRAVVENQARYFTIAGLVFFVASLPVVNLMPSVVPHFDLWSSIAVCWLFCPHLNAQELLVGPLNNSPLGQANFVAGETSAVQDGDAHQ